jgi:hypothetical protein
MTTWHRLPVAARAVISGAIMATAGTLPWALLASGNARYLRSVPWAVPITALYLWFFWRYAEGEGWPAATAAARRTSHRANRLSDGVWGAALFAGMLGLITVVLFQLVMNRLVRLPAQPVDDLAGIPRLTLLFLLIMSGGNLLTSFDLFARGQAEWQASSTPSPLIWETGADASFLLALLALLLAFAASLWAYTGLAQLTRAETRS